MCLAATSLNSVSVLGALQQLLVLSDCYRKQDQRNLAKLVQPHFFIVLEVYGESKEVTPTQSPRLSIGETEAQKG